MEGEQISASKFPRLSDKMSSRRRISLRYEYWKNTGTHVRGEYDIHYTINNVSRMIQRLRWTDWQLSFMSGLSHLFGWQKHSELSYITFHSVGFNLLLFLTPSCEPKCCGLRQIIRQDPI